MPTSPAHRSSGRRTRSTSKRIMRPEDLLDFKFVGDPRIAPDGRRVLFALKTIEEKDKYTTNLWLAPVGEGSPAQFTNGGQDGHGRWSHDGEQVALIRSNRDTGVSQIFTIPSGGGEARQLTRFPEGRISSFKWAPDGRSMAVVFRPTADEFSKAAQKDRKDNGGSTPPLVVEDLWYRLDGDGYFGHQRFAMYLVDTESGEHKPLFNKDNTGEYSYDWSPDSKRLAVTANPKSNSMVKACDDRIYMVEAATCKASPVPGLPKGPKTEVRWSPDGKKLAYAGRTGEDGAYSTENLELWVCDPMKGKATNLTGHTDYCIMAMSLSDASEAVFAPSVQWHPDGKRVITKLGWHGEGHIASVDVKTKAVKFHTLGSFEYSVGDFSTSGKLSLTRASPTTLAEVGVATLSARTAAVSMLTSFNKELLSQLNLAKPSSHWVKTEDGTKVQVWVLRPPASDRKRVPAVLEIHGGPHAQYGVQFFHEFQVLAAAGYAVFFSNPRGSKGYGRDHCHAIRGTWGGADWVDMRAVIDFMKSRDWVNTRKMGIMGGSYGGYMTNWAIGQTDEFAGAITDRCVSNMVSMWGSSDYPYRPNAYWKGNNWDNPTPLWDSSPMKHMGNARTPTLIIHSEGDLRCNIEQSEQVFTVLRTHNVPARFVRYPHSTSHGLSRSGPPDLRLHRLGEILAWWKEYLG